MFYFYSKDLIIEEINIENVFIPHIAEKRWTLNTFQFYIILILNMDFTKSIVLKMIQLLHQVHLY